MAKMDKLIDRLLSNPADFTWEELVKVLGYFGYRELKAGKTGGSRRTFSDGSDVLRFHKPHPANIIKPYVLKQSIKHLKARGKIK